uniref:NR LBD domain-containing protein n=1 Tax=Parascaris equorum TaxID=6256 RepID=A0A914RRK4_PAREQ
MLTSTSAPIHSTIDEALSNPKSTFDDFPKYESAQMLPGEQMNFSYWRAKILSTLMEWAKSFPCFQQLSLQDKHVLVVHTAFSNLVLSEAFHTAEKYTDRIVFPDGLAGFRNLTANILKERSGLIPTVVAVINHILVPIRRMRMTRIEYAINTIGVERQSLLHSLRNHLNSQFADQAESAHRFASLLLRISNVQ